MTTGPDRLREAFSGRQPVLDTDRVRRAMDGAPGNTDLTNEIIAGSPIRTRQLSTETA